MGRVAVTGSSGKLGRAVVADLRQHGWDVVALDRVVGKGADVVSSRVELTDFGQAVEALSGIDELARQLCRWHPDLSMIGLRFSNVMYPEDYAQIPSYDADVQLRRWNLWGYIDARDGAQAVRLALEKETVGADVFIIANADTVMSRPNNALLAEVCPNVPLTRPVGPHETLLSIDKARRVLGYEPQHSWRSNLGPSS